MKHGTVSLSYSFADSKSLSAVEVLGPKVTVCLLETFSLFLTYLNHVISLNK